MKKMTPAVKELRKTIFAWLKDVAKQYDGYYYTPYDHALTIPAEKYDQKIALQLGAELIDFIKPLVTHDLVKDEPLLDVYPKTVFVKTLCLGVWGDGNNHPAKLLTVNVAVGGPYGKIWISWGGASDRIQ